MPPAAVTRGQTSDGQAEADNKTDAKSSKSGKMTLINNETSKKKKSGINMNEVNILVKCIVSCSKSKIKKVMNSNNEQYDK